MHLMTRGRDEKNKDSNFVEIMAGSKETAKEYNDNDGILKNSVWMPSEASDDLKN